MHLQLKSYSSCSCQVNFTTVAVVNIIAGTVVYVTAVAVNNDAKVAFFNTLYLHLPVSLQLQFSMLLQLHLSMKLNDKQWFASSLIHRLINHYQALYQILKS